MDKNWIKVLVENKNNQSKLNGCSLLFIGDGVHQRTIDKLNLLDKVDCAFVGGKVVKDRLDFFKNMTPVEIAIAVVKEMFSEKIVTVLGKDTPEYTLIVFSGDKKFWEQRLGIKLTNEPQMD